MFVVNIHMIMLCVFVNLSEVVSDDNYTFSSFLTQKHEAHSL